MKSYMAKYIDQISIYWGDGEVTTTYPDKLPVHDALVGINKDQNTQLKITGDVGMDWYPEGYVRITFPPGSASALRDGERVEILQIIMIDSSMTPG